MANRARRYERDLRRRSGSTAAAERLLAGGLPVVQAGPFAGLTYPDDRLADIDAPSAKLLGTYEQEIAWVFERALTSNVTAFIDIGCADGYYAVGMAHASAAITTYAYDLASSARDLCAATATASEAMPRVRIGKRFTVDLLASMPTDGALVLCDIEGAEVDLFDARAAAGLARSVVVVEVHETRRPGAGRYLREVFSRTHDAVSVAQAPRREIPIQLGGWSEQDQTRAMSESRDPSLHWLVLTPRAASGHG